MPQMKAAIRRNYCSPSQIKIEATDVPIPADDEILVRVKATTINRTDCANLTAKPFIMRFVLGLMRPRQIILGTDFAGEVISIGKNVRLFQTGDNVFGFDDLGLASQAEYLKVKEVDLHRIPNNIDHKQAAASLEGAHYAYTFTHEVDIQEGQSILINGATGAIGSALLQFTRLYDVKIAATSNTKNIELIKSLGADRVFDYTTEDFTNDEEKYDYIFDAVGKSTFGKCKPLLKEKGVYISSELGPYGQNVFYPLFNSLSNKKVIFPIPHSKQKTIPYINKLLAEEKFKPVIDRKYEFEDIGKAYEYVLEGEKTGNVVMTI